LYSDNPPLRVSCVTKGDKTEDIYPVYYSKDDGDYQHLSEWLQYNMIIIINMSIYSERSRRKWNDTQRCWHYTQ